MSPRISRPLDYAGRFGLQQADQAIKKDVIRALVELITNSDDSYNRLEARDREVEGRIIVDVQRRRQSESVLTVRDYGEGMDGLLLDKALGVYADETSGYDFGEPVRGLFGRGVKDAILGLGEGAVTGIIDNQEHRAQLRMEEGRPHYRAEEPIDLGLNTIPNSTTVEVKVTRDDIRIPQKDNLRKQLILHYGLRDILSNNSRKVIVRNVDGRGKPVEENKLAYQYPVGTLSKETTLSIPKFDTSCKMVLYKAAEPLDTPREAGYNAQAGLLVKSKYAILDNTLLRFDGDPNAQRFYGSVTCSYLDDLLLNKEPILTATRDGLDRSHPFVKELFSVCEDFLDPFVQEEANRVQREVYRAQNQELKQKLETALDRLNEIAREELAELDTMPASGPRDPREPEAGFGFMPEYSSIHTGRKASITLRSLSRVIPEWSIATIESNNPNVSVLTPEVTLKSRKDFDWLCEAKVNIEGVQVGADAIITAQCEGLTAEGYVRVVARIDHDESNTTRRRRGLFGEVRFSEESTPRQRVRYDIDTKAVIVAFNHSTIKPYIYDRTGAGSETPQGQVMLAELISESVCQAIADHGVATGRFATPVGSEAIAVQNQRLRLQNKYSGLIHRIIVDSDYRS